jgi:hypothetical protein
MSKGETTIIGPLTFERFNGVEVGVSTEDEYCGLLDNFYDRHWNALREVENIAIRADERRIMCDEKDETIKHLRKRITEIEADHA